MAFIVPPAIIASPPALCFPSDKSASLPACAEGAHVCVSASCKKHVPFRVDAGRASTTAPCCFCLPFPPPGGENWQPQILALWQLLCDVGRGAYVGVCVCKVRYLSWAYTALQRCAVCQQRQDGSLVLPIEQVQRSPSQRVNKECHAPREASATCPPRRSPSQPTAAWSVGRISRWPSLAPPSGGEPLRFSLPSSPECAAKSSAPVLPSVKACSKPPARLPGDTVRVEGGWGGGYEGGGQHSRAFLFPFPAKSKNIWLAVLLSVIKIFNY